MDTNPSQNRRINRNVWLAAAAILAWYVAAMALRPLMVPDEGRYGGVAWLMHANREDWVPLLNGLPYFHKPPLFYWLAKISLDIFGPHELAVRIPSLIGGAALIISTYLGVREWRGREQAATTALLLAVSPMVMLASGFANLDMLVAGCIAATTWLLSVAVLRMEQGRPFAKILACAYILAGFGFLSKGLIAIVLPGGVITFWLLWERRIAQLPKLLWSPLGWLAFALLVVPWMWSMQQKFPQFFDYFIVEQHFRRFAGKGFNNPQPFWFYIVLLAVLFAPFVVGMFKRAREGFGNTRKLDLRKLASVWFALITLFFSIPHSKLLGYIIPVFPPLAFLAVDAFANKSKRFWKITFAVNALIGTAIAIAANLHPANDERKTAAALIQVAQPNDKIMIVGNYLFAVPFYAHLAKPVQIVDDWNNPVWREKDTYRKELLDAGDFNPALAQQILVPTEQLYRQLCENGATTIIIADADLPKYPLFQGLKPAAHDGKRNTILRVDDTFCTAKKGVTP